MTFKYKHNKKLVPVSRMLRKNMTKEEKHLWYDFLKGYPVNFHRQKIIGNYVVDFYCPQVKLAIELDGSQHYDIDGLVADDEKRTKEIEKYNIKIIRFSNIDINRNFGKVCDDIVTEITARIEENV